MSGLSQHTQIPPLQSSFTKDLPKWILEEVISSLIFTLA